MEEKKIYTGIAVAVALGMFFIFFGGSLFPSVPLLNFFSSSVFGGKVGLSQEVILPIDDTAPVTNETTVTQESTPFDIVENFVRAQDVVVGNGLLAEDGKTVLVGYRVTFVDEVTGEVVVADENLSRENPLAFEIGAGGIIPGFTLGVLGMREGGVRILWVAPEFAYADRQAGVIPPNTELTFEVHLYEVQ